MRGLKLAEGGGAAWVWIRPLGGEAGSGLEAATCELRIYMAILWSAWRLEQSLWKKSRLDFMAWVYWWSMEVNTKMSFSWMASWNTGVRIRIGWLIGG